jgi:tetratricopeptide (TPR) repeat protein
MSHEPLTDLQQGNRCLVRKDYESAVEHFLRHAQSQPEERATAYVQVAECFLRSNTIAQPKAVAPGVTLVSAGDQRSAEYYYRLALQADPDHFGALRGLARVLPDAAVERLSVLERAVSLQPNCLILIDLGDFYRTHRKDFPLAYDTYRRAQEQSPRDKTAYQRLNDVCRRLGRVDEAAEWSARWKQAQPLKRRVDGRTP